MAREGLKLRRSCSIEKTLRNGRFSIGAAVQSFVRENDVHVRFVAGRPKEVGLLSPYCTVLQYQDGFNGQMHFKFHNRHFAAHFDT